MVWEFSNLVTNNNGLSSLVNWDRITREFEGWICSGNNSGPDFEFSMSKNPLINPSPWKTTPGIGPDPLVLSSRISEISVNFSFVTEPSSRFRTEMEVPLEQMRYCPVTPMRWPQFGRVYFFTGFARPVLRLKVVTWVSVGWFLEFMRNTLLPNDVTRFASISTIHSSIRIPVGAVNVRIFIRFFSWIDTEMV